MSDICVIHLVRKKNGLEPFRSFVSSYMGHRAGVEHDLMIIYKGFSSKADMAPYEKLLQSVPHSNMQVADIGYDLRAYFFAAEKLNNKYLCFLNSFSIILEHEWLSKLYQHITQPNVGLVGATGCWGSLIIGKQSTNKNLPVWKKILRKLLWRVIRMYMRQYFLDFPNPHVRTNGFMISRNVMLRIKKGLILTKLHAYRLESGKQSITKQVMGMGLKPIVVGRDGIGYEIKDWLASNTFWHGNQENLLIADNQTRRFSEDNLDLRQLLETFAWGIAANKIQVDKP